MVDGRATWTGLKCVPRTARVVPGRERGQEEEREEEEEKEEEDTGAGRVERERQEEKRKEIGERKGKGGEARGRACGRTGCAGT